MWTPDYFVRLVELPASVEGVTVPSDDGCYVIYIDSRLGVERGRATRAEAPEEAAPPGMKYIPVYPNLESFVADFAKRAEPRSLELLRRAGWKG